MGNIPAGWTGNLEDAIQEFGLTAQQAQEYFSAHPELQAGASVYTPSTAPSGGLSLTGSLSAPVQPMIAPVPTPDFTGDLTDGLNLAGSTDNQGEINITGQRTQTDDFRVRLKPFAGQAFEQIIGLNSPDNILTPLRATNGLLFPYTPSIQFSQDVDWKSIEVTHTNYETAAYSRTPAVSMTISGKFTAQTHAEGRYMLAALHFLRVVSKMYFGKADAQTQNAGVPPPVLLFSGYGPYMFNAVRVIVKNHSYTFDDSVQMVSVKTGTGDIVQLPSLLMLSLTLQVVQTPRAQKDDFNLDEFRTGALMKKGGGWI